MWLVKNQFPLKICLRRLKVTKLYNGILNCVDAE